MTNSETEIFVNLTFADMENAKFPEAEKMWVFAAAKKRAKALDLYPSDSALLFLCQYFQAVGRVVLVIHYIRERVKEGPMNMSMLADIFPNGFWTEQAVIAAWEFQKTHHGNFIDKMLTDYLEAKK